MAVPRPRPGDDADTAESGGGADPAVGVDASRPGDHVTIVAEEPDTEDLFAEAAADRPGWHVRLFGSHEFFRLWLVQVVSALGGRLGVAARNLPAAPPRGGGGGRGGLLGAGG